MCASWIRLNARARHLLFASTSLHVEGISCQTPTYCAGHNSVFMTDILTLSKYKIAKYCPSHLDAIYCDSI